MKTNSQTMILIGDIVLLFIEGTLGLGGNRIES